MSNINRILGLNGTTTAPFFHNNDLSNSEFIYTGFGKSQFIAHGETTVYPDNITNTSSRKSVRFEIAQNFHFIGDIDFGGAFAATTGDAAIPDVLNNRLINWAPREQIDYIELKSGKSAKKPIRINGRLLHTDHYISTVLHDLEGISVLELGNMSTLERTNAFTQRQEWEVEIKTPFDELSSHLPLASLMDDLIIEIFFKPDEAILCYNGATPQEIVREDMYLTFRSYFFFKQAYQKNIEGVFNTEGVTYFMRDVDYYDSVYDSTHIKNRKIDISLKDFNNEVTAFWVTIRYEDHVLSDGDPALDKGNFGYDRLEPWVSHEIKDGNFTVIEPVPYRHQVYKLNRKNLMYPVGLNVIAHLNGHALADRFHCYGSYNPAGFQNGIFSITLTDEMITEMTVNNRKIIIEFTCIVNNTVTLISRTGNPENPRVTMVGLFDM